MSARTKSAPAVTTASAHAEMVESGFFVSPEELPGEGEDQGELRLVGLAGMPQLPHLVPFARVRVELTAEEPREHFVLDVHHPCLSEGILLEVRAALGRAYPLLGCAFIVESSAGRAKVVHREEGSPFAVAAAAATWMRVGSWDETDPILVVVDGRAVAARLQRAGGGWRATLSEARPR